MLAILEDGVRSYLSSVPRVRAEAELWISTRRQRSPFSFHVVCETLGLEPSAVKAALRRLRAQGPAARATLIRRSRPNVRRNGRLTVRRSA
jgi:DNA-binding MarR family transcriptional regulator